MTKRVFNFSSGPAVLPLSVLERAQAEMLSLPGVGISVLEISHRSKPFEAILAAAESNLRKLLNIPDNYKVLFLQGGAQLQFSMVPINLLRGAGRAADYVVTGSWGQKAQAEARREGEVRTAWDGKATNFDRLPAPGEAQLNPAGTYVHITSNETIQGVQFPASPVAAGLVGGGPVVCDSSSDILSRPVPVSEFGIIYACAQKNAGPSGVTVVIIRDDLLALAPEGLPSMLDYRVHAANGSMFNTPPTFAIYLLKLVTEWLQDEVGGLAKMALLNAQKARLLYEVLDSSDGFYQGHAQPHCRSQMNVTFKLADEALEKAFLKEAETHDLCTLAGHRSVGGVRASIYNAMPLEGVERLRDFMLQFRKKH